MGGRWRSAEAGPLRRRSAKPARGELSLRKRTTTPGTVREVHEGAVKVGVDNTSYTATSYIIEPVSRVNLLSAAERHNPEGSNTKQRKRDPTPNSQNPQRLKPISYTCLQYMHEPALRMPQLNR